MKYKNILTLSMTSILAALAGPAWAVPNCSAGNATTFEPAGSEGSWFLPANWSNFVPGENDIACITAGKKANIDDDAQQAACEELYIKEDPTAGRGQVEIEASNSFRIDVDDGGPSQIDGDLFVNFGEAELIIDGAVTINGDGGEIIGGDYFGFPWELVQPTIKPQNATGDKLTITGGSSRATSLVVRGNMFISVELVNNAFVVADDRDWGIVTQGDLVLSGSNAHSGTGYWIAEKNDAEGTFGLLVVDTEVKGDGSWVLSDDATAEIQINTVCDFLTGSVQVHKGILTLKADFDTSGKLELKSIGRSTPRITLDTGVFANFDEQ